MEPLRTERRDYWIDRADVHACESALTSKRTLLVPIVTGMDSSQELQWRRLGDLLMSEGLVEPADLEYALAVQRQKGGLLGEILVSLGFVSITDIANALGGQHGVQVDMAIRRREQRLRVPPPPREGSTAWRPLGRVLVEKGLLTESGLERALVDQCASGRLLGEIVVTRGWVSAEDLTRAIAEQHGIVIDELEVRPAERSTDEVTEVYEVRSGEEGLLHTSSTFLDATDLAFELIERDDPAAMEIVRVDGDDREQVWAYSRERAEEEAKRATALGPFGYNIIGWQAGRRFGEQNGDRADHDLDDDDAA